MTVEKITKDQVPKRRKGYHNLQKLIYEFVQSDAEAVKIQYKPGEYANVKSCYMSLWNAIKCSKHESVTVCLRGDEIYLYKTI